MHSIVLTVLNFLIVQSILKGIHCKYADQEGQSGQSSLLSFSQQRLFQQFSHVIHGEFGETYNLTVNSSTQVIFEFTYLEVANKTTALRVSTELKSVPDQLEHFPLLVVVRQQEAIVSWQLPMLLEYIYPFEKVSRTLCPMDLKHRRELTPNQTIYVDISTMYSQGDVPFSLRTIKVEDFQIRPNERKSVVLTSSEPQYYMFTFPDNVDSVIIHAISDDNLCAIMSIQDVMCPVFDLNRDVKFQGKYQTMSTQAAITVVKNDYDEGSFYVVFVLKPRDMDCNGIETIQPAGTERIKHLNVRVYGTISATKYYLAIVAAVAVFAVFYLSAMLIGIFYHGCTKNRGIWMQAPQFEPEDSAENGPSSSLTSDRPTSYGTIPQTEPAANIQKELRSVPRNHSSPNAETVDNLSQSSIDSDDIDFLDDANSEKEIVRTKTAVFVCDLSRKKYKKEHKKYTLYWRNLIIIAIFYGLPVLQLVFTYQKVLNVTGNLDICYYNFNCAHPLGLVTSFNNVFSNIGYVLLGILFILLVWRRNIIYNAAVSRDKSVKKEYGIPQHFGLFYGMGLALIMEGIMSACYHICPNYTNFQFDTSFMYIIACLCMLKIYQTRHPDIGAKAHTSYLIMALVIFIAVLGVIYSSSIFWIIFAVVDMTFYLVLSTQIYYMGRWKIDRGICRRFWMTLRYDICRKPLYPDRLVLLLIGTVLNWGFAIYGALTEPSDFASFLLGIFIGNLLLYCLFYIIMKIRYREKIHLLAKMCLLITTIVWIAALFFFFQHLTTWQETPAGSREGNKDCLILDFYDAHDIWHMLSAMALFFSFLILLTIDDDLFSTRRDSIPVF